MVLLVVQLSLGSSCQHQCSAALVLPPVPPALRGHGRDEPGETRPRCSSPDSHGQPNHARPTRETGRQEACSILLLERRGREPAAEGALRFARVGCSGRSEPCVAGKRALADPRSGPGGARVRPRDQMDVSTAGVLARAGVCMGATPLGLMEMRTATTQISAGGKMVVTAQL